MELISVERAEALIGTHFQRLPEEEVALADATGRILRQSARAERAQPPFDRVTMDGIALNSDDYASGRRVFTLAGIQAAGQAPLALADSGSCIEIMTGAVLPPGCDCVVPVEDLVITGGEARLRECARVEPGRYVHKTGSDHAAGTTLLEAGCRLNAPAISVLASCGYPSVAVSARPGICVIATGNELVSAAGTPEAHQIRSSNAPAMAAAIRAHGWGEAEVLHLPDDPEVLEAEIALALDRNDLLILSGGVSKGRFDFIPEVLAALGVTAHFHRVSQRPGKPLWFGTRDRDGKIVFGLPGNPVSSLVCMQRYVIPALVRGGGGSYEPPAAELGEGLSFEPPLTWFVPVTVASESGTLVATPHLTNTSGDFAALAGTHGFVELPAGKKSFPKGFPAAFFSWDPC